jgi:pantoate--beta-alanine ligase
MTRNSEVSDSVAPSLVLASAAEVREFRHTNSGSDHPLCIVPTMGDLHQGHLDLVRIARSLGPTIVSIFVNPTQFSPGEDFDRYPRRLEADREKLSALGVDAIYAPPVVDVYPPGEQTRVEVRQLTEPLCGQHREGHFLGVTTVCTKLFNIVRPDIAVFGQKDAQQCLVIHRLLRDLHFDVDLCIGPTGRNESGVALSSRNRYLSQEERPAARALSHALDRAETLLREGERDRMRIEAAMHEVFGEYPVGVDYADVRRVPDLSQASRVEGRVLVAVAAMVGRARLLDNRCFEVGEHIRIAPLLDHCTPSQLADRWTTRASLPEEFCE